MKLAAVIVGKKEIHVLVPSSYEEKEIAIPVDRNSKRFTLTACISADGQAMKPFVIINRVTINQKLLLAGYGPDVVRFVHQPHSFMTKRLFEKWTHEVFFPTLSLKRLHMNYYKQALLLMDGFGAHLTSDFEKECLIHNVKVRFLVPHSSDTCQPLDAITFAHLKRNYGTNRCESYDSRLSNQIVRMMRAWSAATSYDLVVQTFRSVGIVPYVDDESQMIYCQVDLTFSLKLKSLFEDQHSTTSTHSSSKRDKHLKIDS
jgi:hypothetical protein